MPNPLPISTIISDSKTIIKIRIVVHTYGKERPKISDNHWSIFFDTFWWYIVDSHQHMVKPGRQWSDWYSWLDETWLYRRQSCYHLLGFSCSGRSYRVGSRKSHLQLSSGTVYYVWRRLRLPLVDFGLYFHNWIAGSSPGAHGNFYWLAYLGLIHL